MIKFLKWIFLGVLASMANDCIPFKKPGEDLTAQCTAGVTGKTFLAVSGNRTSGPLLSATAEGSNYQVATCGAGLKALGVAMYDAPSGGFVGIIVGGIVPVTAGASVTAGQEVQSDGAGKAIPLAAGRPCGYAMNGATTGNDCEVLLYD